MRDFGAILKRAALEVVKIAGPSGPTGPDREFANEVSSVEAARSGTTSQVALVPVVPDDGCSDKNGTTGTSGVERVVPAGGYENIKQIERLADLGTTGTSGTTENNEVLKKSASAQIRWATLRNSIDLFELQTDTSHCFVCREREDSDRPFIPVLTASPGRHHWIHLQCHGQHIDRINARVDVAFANQPPF